jgi:hypothetical protein
MYTTRQWLLAALLTSTACTTSDPIEPSFRTPDLSPSGGGGAVASGGQAGNTASGAAGTAGGAAGTVAAAGTSGGAAATGAAGTMAPGSGAAGNTGGAGTMAAAPDAGRSDAGADATPRDGAATDAPVANATWAYIYGQLFNNSSYASNCAGGGCHDPGTQKGLDFSTAAKGYTTAKAKLSVGNPAGSKLVSVLSSGSMPQTRPKMPAADLAIVKAWIMAGALNN